MPVDSCVDECVRPLDSLFHAVHKAYPAFTHHHRLRPVTLKYGAGWRGILR